MKIEQIFLQTQKELKKSLYNALKSLSYSPIKQDGFIFAQGEHPVLLVAHLDTVHKHPVSQICYSKDGSIIMSPQGIGGDDRCGVYMILEIVKKIKCSVLFCEDEEMGAIGAGKFITSNIIPQNVNYIVELDRKGANDAVFYDCANEEFIKFITEAGFVESYGSFSDISEIAPHLGLAAVNISSGYYNAHTQHEYVDLNDVNNNIYRVCKLIIKNSKRFNYIKKVYSLTNFAGNYSLITDDDFDWFGQEHQFYSTANNLVNETNCNYKNLMLITEDLGYIVTDTGVLDDGDNYCIDMNNKVYVYDWESDFAYEVKNYQVKNHHGGNVRFDNKLAIPIITIDVEDFA